MHSGSDSVSCAPPRCPARSRCIACGITGWKSIRSKALSYQLPVTSFKTMARVVGFAGVALVVIVPLQVLAGGNWQLPTGNWELLNRYESVEPQMGTLVKITVYASTEDEARRAFRAGFDRIGELDAILSDYKPDSELSRVT